MRKGREINPLRVLLVADELRGNGGHAALDSARAVRPRTDVLLAALPFGVSRANVVPGADGRPRTAVPTAVGDLTEGGPGVVPAASTPSTALRGASAGPD